jgi:hypothetical protein
MCASTFESDTESRAAVRVLSCSLAGRRSNRPARRKNGNELFGHNRDGDLDIRYSGDPDHRARHLKGEIVLSLKIGFCGI